MSEKILKALMQLFAIIANTGQLTAAGRNVVEAFLRQQVRHAHINYYLGFFDEYLEFLQGKAGEGKARKRISVNSVKILRICTDINSELDQKQKYIVFVKLIEFARSFGEEIGEQEYDFIKTVAEVFNISSDIELCFSFVAVSSPAAVDDHKDILLVSNQRPAQKPLTRFLLNETLEGSLVFLNIRNAAIVFVKYTGSLPLTLNGQALTNGRVYVFSQGSVIRGSRMQPVYYSDVMQLLLDDGIESGVQLTARNVDFFFPNKRQGMHSVSFSASSGNLIGIMGGSGAGKSTLLNILNGNLIPAKGEVLINGINIHTQRELLEGVIGYIPQDDLLMEDLSVYQNLYYNSKLGLGEATEDELKVLVDQLLSSLGLMEIKDLKVGDVLNKTVSGGQRKRLNIALELIRKPSVLFVDEPTSGLSSLDSENVMDLLKQLSLGGKLVLVVIHQPSSDIFKLFDKLLILDTGGYPIYYGNPSDAIIHFKKKANFADADSSECETCGNINPEQIFSIIEGKVFDEFGNTTSERKITPVEWNKFFNEEVHAENIPVTQTPATKKSYKKPSLLRQLGVFITRDVLSKLRNTQYLLINFLEAPVLAFILSYFLKYYRHGGEYIFRDNLNLPAYIFMCVIIALFMGLTVSAEEIIRDRKILKRESFLNLSRGSYLFSKIGVLFLISAIQTLSFVLIGNTIFEIDGMSMDYWLMLFSVSCFGNLLGLNISATFSSAVTIYILIPFLIIPQIILSGVMVKFENLNPEVTSQTKVPLIGELMASRWAFEALAVNQYKNNEYQKHFFRNEKQTSKIVYMKDFWLVKMNDKLDSLYRKQADAGDFILLQNELNAMNGSIPNLQPVALKSDLSKTDYDNAKNFLSLAKKYYMNRYKELARDKDQIVARLSKTHKNDAYLGKIREQHTNESLEDLLLTTNDFEFIIEDNNRFVRRFRPVLMNGPDHTFRSQLFVSSKNIFGKYHSTWWVNIGVIWGMTLIMIVALYMNGLKRLLFGINAVIVRLRSL